MITAPVDSRHIEPVGPPVLEDPRISLDGDATRSRRRRAAPAEPVERAYTEETVHAGSEAHPGRTIRVRDTR